MCWWAFSVIPRRLHTQWARQKPLPRSSRVGAEWWAPNFCYWCSMCGSCAPSTRRLASSFANGGALTNGQGNVFLWLFCALALLKIAQKCDSYLAALGLSVAQTGSSMGMEMLMAARVLTGFSKGGGNAASVFGGGARGGAGSAAGTAGGVAAGGILSGFMNRYRPNSFVRDAVVDGGSRMGAGGGVGFVGRAFGGMAARNGATLTPNSISSVATRPPNVSGTIGGEIADRSISGYLPQLAGGSMANMTYSGTPDYWRPHQLLPPPRRTGGRLRWIYTAQPSMRCPTRHTRWLQPPMEASGIRSHQGRAWVHFMPLLPLPAIVSEAAQVSEAFPSAPEGTLLRQVDDGTLEASYPDGGNSLWYSSAYFQEPDAPHEVIQGADGLSWYAMTPAAAVPEFEPATPAPSGGGLSPSAQYNAALFGQFMPGFDQPVVSVDSSRSADGILEVRHEGRYRDGLLRPDYVSGAPWRLPCVRGQRRQPVVCHSGTPAVERRPVYEDGKPVYDGDKLQTTTVETMRYKSTPSRYTQPQKRPVNERKPPNRKKP